MCPNRVDCRGWGRISPMVHEQNMINPQSLRIFTQYSAMKAKNKLFFEDRHRLYFFDEKYNNIELTKAENTAWAYVG